MNWRVPLGVKVRDVVSGSEGIVVARTEWLNGCVRVGFQPPNDKDGKPVEMVTVDEPQLEVIGPSVLLPGERWDGSGRRDGDLARAGGGGRNDRGAQRR